MNEKMSAVIEYNRTLQCKARELNTRVGENIFPVMGKAEWKSWLAVRLNGARRAGEIANLGALRLPELDQEIVNLIMSENTDTIEVLGRNVAVEYRSGYTPRVRMDFRGTESLNWLSLPDEGIRLPGGREVAMYSVVEGYGYYIDANSSQFKGKVRECLNQGLWEKWPKPEIAIPDLAAEGSTIPEILEKEYGKCVVSEVSLVAFGAIVACRTYWSTDPISWKYEWYRDRKTAEENRQKSVEALGQYQVTERKKRALSEARASAVSVKDNIRELYYHDDKGKIERELMDKLNSIYCCYSPSGLEELLTWTAEAKTVCALIKAAYAEILCKREARKDLQIPSGLLGKKAFNGDEDRAYEFMRKVAALPASRIDGHIIGFCGRGKVYDHLIEISGDENFFLGADPNAVVFYISQVHCHSMSYDNEPIQNVGPATPVVSESFGSLADAFKKAGFKVK